MIGTEIMGRHWTAWEQDCMRWHGRILTGKDAHWCWDWDCLPIDETCPEFENCSCLITDEPETP